MSARSQLEAYLREFRERLKALILARGSAVLSVTALALTLIAVYFGTRRAFDPEFIIGARTVLVLGLGAVVAWLLIMPLRALRSTRGVADIERRAPAFDGRIETYDGLARADTATPSPFVDLLAEDSLKVAARAPVAANVRTREISIPAIVGVAAAVVLVWFAAFGPDNWRYGVRHLWAGWLIEDTLPPQRIAVSPGDGTVRRGGDLLVEAAAEGFDPTTMDVYARFASRTDWQAVPMRRLGGDEGFDFTFFAVREPLRYYVSAAGIRSQEYGIEVVDLPEVTQIKLTYEYPAWTKLEPVTEEHGSDIRAVEGTVVTVEVHTDRPLASAMLVANDQELPLETNGNVGTAELRVDADGEYHVATVFNDDRVGLTEDYLISLVPDKKPTVKIARPGRDWRASNIEEVTVAVDANDDFDLDGLELRYSINGGEWATVTLPADGAQVSAAEILYLEDLRQPSAPETEQQDLVDLSRPLTVEDLRALREEFEAQAEAEARAAAEGEAAPDAEAAAPAERSLEPGDLISYYAVATDRGQTTQTDLFFVEVQPFERSFTQAGGGAGGGGGGGQQQDEISRRQKEILVATWNLIREQKEQESFLDEQQLEDNARMLAELQRTLAEQAQTLASRARARQLTGGDPKIRTFVESLEQAVKAMGPAAERLADLALSDAVPPEQQALQFLLRAEAVFTDIQVSMQRNGGGGGGLAGRDLSELYELEMDLEKNQYETESPVALEGEEQGQQELDEAIAKLQELARRQEQLAQDAARRNQLTERERWEQESLRRETEELKRQLQELQQRLANQQSQQGQQGEQGEQSQGAQGQSGTQSGQAQSAQTAQTIEQLEEALQAMNRASAQGDLDPEQTRRAIEQARRQLQAALEQMTAGRQAAVEEAYSDLAERAEELYAEQRQVASDLQRAVEDAASNPGNGFRGGLDRRTAFDLADRKYDLQQTLEALEQDIQRVAQQFSNQTPGASDELNEALANLQQSQAVARLAIAGDYIRQGGAAQIAPTEAVTTSALRDLERDTEQALAVATREAVSGEETEPDPNAELVAELQALRRQLATLTQAEAEANAQGNQPGQSGQGQAPGEQPGQQAGGQQAGGQQAGGPQVGGAFGGGDDRYGWGGPGGFYDPRRDAIWGPRGLGVWQDPATIEQLREQLDSAGTNLINLGQRLRAEGLSDEELRAIRELGDALRAGLTGNPELVEAEYRALVNLTEQLELALLAEQDAATAAVRTEAPAQAARGFEEIVAEYYRRLSRPAL
jgi:hypothetical protein